MKNQFKKGLLMLMLFISTISISAQVPLFNSHPNASAVLFLDFDGHTVTGTGWNYMGPIVCGASGLDNTKITSIFNSVAEDYRPFNINVTTDSTKFLAAPINKRMRVIITISSSWYGSAGGVAFIGSFIWGDDTPCFVFSALLGYNAKKISEASSHEAGHTLGLYHQSTYDASCGLISDYNYGQGTGEISWAPIMGVGYSRNATTWYNGPNSYGCNNYQNDLDSIISKNGFTYRPDDFAETFPSAAAQSFVNNGFTINGMISTPVEKDMFKFTLTNTKRVVINAIPSNVGAGNANSNLDIAMQLFNSATTSIGNYNPALTLNATVDTILNPGTYYIRIDGVGNLNTPEYGSLGNYSINATQSDPAILPLRKLELQGELNGDKHQFNWTIDADEQVTEQILEVATDGLHFSPVTNSAVAARSFTYKPYVTTNAFYRLKVTFDNGRYYYSNVVLLKQSGSAIKPKLVTNLINTNTIMITSPGAYSYSIYDFNGKTVRKGQLTIGLNNVDASTITNGMYLVQFANDTEQWIDKLVRQ
jgi:Bacterial pre-peptidase C-terminal domain/Secretion system C-terminal sorting domain